MESCSPMSFNLFFVLGQTFKVSGYRKAHRGHSAVLIVITGEIHFLVFDEWPEGKEAGVY